MAEQEKVFRIKDDNLEIKRIPFWRLLWFARLNIEIHKKDPIFKKAKMTTSSRIKFLISFSWKLLFQSRFILLENSKVAGALSLDVKKHSIFVYAVGLLEEYRRKGYGSYLMRFTEDFAKKRKRNFVNFSVLLENKPAVKMYEKLGYHSQGLGLTLIRYFREKLMEINEKELQEKIGLITFRKISKNKDIERKAIHWWSEEIEAIAGLFAKNISIKDGLLEFDFKSEWKIYEILLNNKESGLVAILPSEVFLTIVFFSNPETTWSMNWTKLFLYTILKEKLGQTLIRKKTKSTGLLSMNNSPLIQIFLTYQHMESLKQENKALFVHDPMEDRQILFKILD